MRWSCCCREHQALARFKRVRLAQRYDPDRLAPFGRRRFGRLRFGRGRLAQRGHQDRLARLWSWRRGHRGGRAWLPPWCRGR